MWKLAERKPSWGFKKMFVYLKYQQGYGCNHKRIYRVYCELKVNLLVKPRKQLPLREPQPLAQSQAANQSWSLDFMSDSLASGHPFCTLNIIDDFNREALWIEIDTSLPAERIIRILYVLATLWGYPKQIRLDNGPELISQKMAAWAAAHAVELAYIQPGKPAQNAYIERFNNIFREAVLDANLFSSLHEAREITAEWVEEYNAVRPHEALQNRSPYQHVAEYA